MNPNQHKTRRSTPKLKTQFPNKYPNEFPWRSGTLLSSLRSLFTSLTSRPSPVLHKGSSQVQFPPPPKFDFVVNFGGNEDPWKLASPLRERGWFHSRIPRHLGWWGCGELFVYPFFLLGEEWMSDEGGSAYLVDYVCMWYYQD